MVRVAVDQFVSDEWYPGFRPVYGHTPWINRPLDTFRREDEDNFWVLDFHWPRGLTPLGIVAAEDVIPWGNQLAAEMMPLPPARGLQLRIAGTHIYMGQLPIASPWEVGFLAARFERELPRFLQRFDELWAERVEELELGLSHFEALDLSRTDLAELARHLADARAFHRRAWAIHFEVMYPLAANYLGLYQLCAESGIDPTKISTFLQGADTKPMEADRGLWGLTGRARAAGLEPLFAAHEPAQLRPALAGHGGSAGEWLTAFDDFLAVFGHRSEGIADPALPSWSEDPSLPLGMVRTFLTMDASPDFAAKKQQALDERDAAVDAARSGLTGEQQQAFDEALARCRAANFAWWNEDHNHYIDLRVSLTIRTVALAIAATVGAERPDDTMFCFYPELLAVAQGERPWSEFKGLVDERRDYFDHWLGRRGQMPKVLGLVPDKVDDPLLVEILGVHRHFLDEQKHGAGTTLSGFPASAGTVTGRARVLHDATDLHTLQPGEILVCEATSPNWTPAFATIAGCVCDAGGSLTHAAIVSREYRIPAVVGTNRATSVISSGDLIEVNGTTGTVRVVTSR
jgi:pyruvate,water dikinase